MPHSQLTRDELAERYLEQLPYQPYPVQEEALLAWFTSEQGVLVCAPTGTGKTVIAEAALFEALHTGRIAYYTTPLIALTEQKFAEMQANAVRWGFSADDVGLVTGNRKVNPNARILVVVAEILLNRLLHPEGFSFEDVDAVVMDEFHSFNDRERGIVWELSLALLPRHVRLLLLSATVGNSTEFVAWLKRSHGRSIELVEGTERRVPLTYHWVEDLLLNELIEEMASGDEATRRTPALIFCFNRDECWTVAEQLKGKPLVGKAQQQQLAEELKQHDWTTGVGPKLQQLLIRGVGVHHAGMLPRYRRIVEDLYLRKLLAVTVCTETLAAGINLPARSVVLSTLLKGPFGKKTMIEPSVAHQIFGRAGRPQFDTEGHVYALAHEDDVKILRWRQKYESIPEDTKDPGLLAAKKALKKKRPTRRDNQQYWTEQQFDKLKTAPPGKLASRGHLPWRLLAYMLELSPEVARIRQVVHKRLMDDQKIQEGEATLIRMLRLLHHGGYVTLDPPPPENLKGSAPAKSEQPSDGQVDGAAATAEPAPAAPRNAFAAFFAEQQTAESKQTGGTSPSGNKPKDGEGTERKPAYEPIYAHPTPQLQKLLVFKSVNPLYGAFLVEKLAMADRDERIQALESVLELPGPIARQLQVPPPEELPPGPLAMEYLDPELLKRGLMLPPSEEKEEEPRGRGGRGRDRDEEDEGSRMPPLAEKLRLLFDSEFPRVPDLRTQAVWAAGEILRAGGDFNKFVKARDLVKQEGIIFRHLLRLILLCGEFAQLTPEGVAPAQWQSDFRELADKLTEICRAVDPESTDKMIEEMAAPDVVDAEALDTKN